MLWTESGIEGCWRFVQRLWRLFDAAAEKGDGARDVALDKACHRAIAGVAADIESLTFNKAVAKIYELVNAIEKSRAPASRHDAISILPRLISPMLPHLAEEGWQALGGSGLVAEQSWPDHDPAMLVDDDVTIAVQINGKLRDTITLPRDASREVAQAAALANTRVQTAIAGANPKKIIVVPGRLVNIVV